MDLIKRLRKSKVGESNWRECICSWQLGMGPNLNCPVHGRPELVSKSLIPMTPMEGPPVPRFLSWLRWPWRY